MKHFVEIPKVKLGDQVAIVSPSGDAAGRFPWVYETSLVRLQNDFGLKPKEYASTRQIGASHKEKAKDLMDAFADPDNKAVFATIGGFDQIKMIKLLDPAVFTNNPKAFFGSSDNTHFVNFLWQLGIPSYYCGSIMPQFAFPVAMPELSVEYLKKALFDKGEYEVKSSPEFNEETFNWADKETWATPRKMEANIGWLWDGDEDAEGILWGGCLESMVVKFASGIGVPADEDLDGCILFLETSEELPQLWAVAYVLTGMGERGYFDRFRAVLMGRPKAWHVYSKTTPKQKKEYRNDQYDLVLKTIREYNKTIPVIQNLDFGHTDPQIVVPSGKKARISNKDKKIFFTY